MTRYFSKVLLSACAALAAVQAADQHPKPPKSLRLYIFDCGTIHTTNADAYSLKKEEVGSTLQKQRTTDTLR